MQHVWKEMRVVNNKKKIIKLVLSLRYIIQTRRYQTNGIVSTDFIIMQKLPVIWKFTTPIYTFYVTFSSSSFFRFFSFSPQKSLYICIIYIYTKYLYNIFILLSSCLAFIFFFLYFLVKELNFLFFIILQKRNAWFMYNKKRVLKTFIIGRAHLNFFLFTSSNK